jgi:2-hydroxychromene-2-carboxylate isomerase
VSKSFDFVFDVGGPNSYLAHKVLPEFCARTGATATYVPILLGGLFKATGNRAPIIRYADAPAKWAYEQLEFMRFVQTHGLSAYRQNPHFPVNSLLAMRVITGARGAADFMPVVEALMTAMWERGDKLDERHVLVSALNAAGLDGEPLAARADDPAVKAALASATEAAVGRGAFGVPTFFVGNEMFWGKERLGQIEAMLTAS